MAIVSERRGGEEEAASATGVAEKRRGETHVEDVLVNFDFESTSSYAYGTVVTSTRSGKLNSSEISEGGRETMWQSSAKSLAGLKSQRKKGAREQRELTFQK